MNNSVKAILIENTADELRDVFLRCDAAVLERAREVRVRQGLPLAVTGDAGEFFLGAKGDRHRRPEGAFRPEAGHIAAMLSKLCNHSLYAYDAEIKNGHITIAGGHRIGLSGRVTVEDGRIKTIKHISGLSIRIARQVLGAADAVFPMIAGDFVRNTIIVSPPGCGKTTLLRDVVRRLSLAGHNIAVVDERSEIGGCHLGAAQNDLGPRTDVLDAAPKAAGMMLALRALSPQVIAVDEIGGSKDAEAIENMAGCGVAVICTLHGRSIADLRRRPALAPLIENKIFERYVFLTDKPAPGSICGVYDENLEVMRHDN
ncbi:MAG: stage III sporulation protein AA [Clostridiales bacterium]|jgi:stage III sporulation protein AA|nr:stage III sporulation protein AA [Clostridiales bacterium]